MESAYLRMPVQTIPAIMTNDPKQRPAIGVWNTAFNYLVPMALSMLFNVVLLPKFGGHCDGLRGAAGLPRHGAAAGRPEHPAAFLRAHM